jgi:2-oxoglutarate ferredoxin oxidoreductase subunit delta
MFRRIRVTSKTRKIRPLKSPVINVDWCKGCGLCVFVCPKKVFAMSKDPSPRGYFPAIAEHPENCVACGQCEILCPDLAITLEES